MSDLRQAIREILAEELARLRPEAGRGAAAQVTEEVVTIRSGADLNAFAIRLLERAQDGRLRAELVAGRHRFVLAHDGVTAYATPPVHAHQPVAPPSAPPVQAEFLRGMVSERDIAGLAEGTRTLRIGKAVRLTPLARDEITRRGIQLERLSA